VSGGIGCVAVAIGIALIFPALTRYRTSAAEAANQDRRAPFP
jgi:hypothetical protein